MNTKLVIGLFAVTGAVGCGGSTTNNNGNTIDGTNKAQYAANSLTLPTGPTQLAIDLNGDGTKDNRLGQIVGALTFAMINAQATVQASVAAGSAVLLFDEVSTDATQQSAKNAGTQFVIGNTVTTAPKFDGTDAFTANGAPAQFYGNITGGTFTSDSPVTAKTPVEFSLSLALVMGQPPLNLPITAGYITYTTDASGKVTGGQMNGGVKKSDIDGSIVPTVAALLTAQIKADPTNTTLKSFDTDGNGTVTAAEVSANPTIAPFLAPDVQLFDAAGNYAPNKANTTKDSLSIGVGFTAVKAMWQ
ncbi:MAG: hypothetical protein ABI321_04530 [Polyangia bacterium]